MNDWRLLHPRYKWSTLDSALVHSFNVGSTWSKDASCATLVYWSAWHQHKTNSHLKTTSSVHKITDVDAAIPRLGRLERLSSKTNRAEILSSPLKKNLCWLCFLHMMNVKQPPFFKHFDLAFVDILYLIYRLCSGLLILSNCEIFPPQQRMENQIISWWVTLGYC